MSARALRSLVVLSVLSVCSTAFAQGADEEQFKELFRAGKEAFERGNIEESYQKFEQALRIKVDDRLVLYMHEEAGHLLLERMLVTGGKIRETALRILELSKGRARNIARSDEELEALVQKLDSEDFSQVTDASLRLMATGTWACKALVAHLGDPKSDILRTNVIVVLGRMRDESTLAVVEALNSTDKLTAQNAAVVLFATKDIRSLGELRRLDEDGAVDAEVKTFVKKAINETLAAHPEERDLGGKNAKETYVALAERYYRSHPSVMHYMFGDHVVWRWSAASNSLVGREVPPWSMNEELAEEACHDAIRIDNGYAAAWSLLGCVSFAQWEEAGIATEDADQKLSLGQINADERKKLADEIANVEQASLLGQMVGNVHLYSALSRSLADDTAAVSVHILRAIAKTGKWEELKTPMGAALSEALVNKDKRVRYAASETAVALRPKESFTNSDAVIPNLADAVSQQAVRVVLIIEPDDNKRNIMRENFQQTGCYVIEASDAKSGIMRAKEFPNEDLIVCDGTTIQTVVFSVNILGKNQAEASVLDSLQEDLRTKSIPIIVTGNDGAELANWKNIFKDEVAGYMEKSANADDIRKLTDELFARDFVLNRSKLRAELSAETAARALASIRVQDTIFSNYANAHDALAAALENRPDKIRIPVAMAMGALVADGKTDALSKVLSDAGNSAELRAASAEALGEIFRQSGSTPNDDCIKALVAGITDADMVVQRATAKAIGAAHLPADKAAMIFEMKRLHQLK